MDQAPNDVARDPELGSRLAHGEPDASLVGGAVGVDTVNLADGTDAGRRPGLALTGADAHPIERGGDIGVTETRRHARHHGEGLVRCAATVFARRGFAHAQFRVLPATPVDDQHDPARRLVDIGDDVDDQRSDQLLSGPGGDAGRLPRRGKVLGHPVEVGRRGRVFRASIALRRARQSSTRRNATSHCFSS